ncbi:MAG: CvpA family protein [Actinobacteria bacterium]|nr:CvpA family protein [Actinomycetota bacterium]
MLLIGLAAFGGYRVGFVTRVTSWLGLVAGIVVAIVVTPRLLDALNQSTDAQVRALVAVGVFVLVASAGATLGEVAGLKLRRLIPPGPARQVDRGVGAVAAGAGVLVLLWLLMPALSEVPGRVSSQVRNSAIAQAARHATGCSKAAASRPRTASSSRTLTSWPVCASRRYRPRPAAGCGPTSWCSTQTGTSPSWT